MWVCISLIAVAAIILVFYVIEKIRSYSIKAVLIKFVVSLLFVAVAVYSSYVNGGHPLSPFVIIGLLLGLSGDIWLDLKLVYPKDDKIYTYAGFIVFGLGHIFYVTGLFIQYLNNAHVLYIIMPIIGALLCGFINLFLEKPLKLAFKDMKGVVFAYSILLFSLPLSCLSLLIANSWQPKALIIFFVGGILFAVSDLVLSNTYFGKDHEKPIDFILNYLTYYSAQFVIAFSLFFI